MSPEYKIILVKNNTKNNAQSNSIGKKFPKWFRKDYLKNYVRFERFLSIHVGMSQGT